MIIDRYTLGLLMVALLCLIRYYQERIQLRLPLASVLMVGIMAVYGVAITHNMFSFDRARVALAAELRDAGIPDTSVDNGWEYNIVVELGTLTTSTSPRSTYPVQRLRPPLPLPAGTGCQMFWYDNTPHITPALRHLLRARRLRRSRALRSGPLLALAGLPGTRNALRRPLYATALEAHSRRTHCYPERTSEGSSHMLRNPSTRQDSLQGTHCH